MFKFGVGLKKSVRETSNFRRLNINDWKTLIFSRVHRMRSGWFFINDWKTLILSRVHRMRSGWFFLVGLVGIFSKLEIEFSSVRGVLFFSVPCEVVRDFPLSDDLPFLFRVLALGVSSGEWDWILLGWVLRGFRTTRRRGKRTGKEKAVAFWVVLFIFPDFGGGTPALLSPLSSSSPPLLLLFFLLLLLLLLFLLFSPPRRLPPSSSSLSSSSSSSVLGVLLAALLWVVVPSPLATKFQVHSLKPFHASRWHIHNKHTHTLPREDKLALP